MNEPIDVDALTRNVLREFQEEMQEHGEIARIQPRFYSYLQTALRKALEMPGVRPGSVDRLPGQT